MITFAFDLAENVFVCQGQTDIFNLFNIMKGIKTIFGALAIAGLLAFSFNASAQENGNRDEDGNIVRGPYETNGFWQNWFIGIGGGVQEATTVRTFGVGYGGWLGEINVGTWITPAFGIRLDIEVGQNKLIYSSLTKGVATSADYDNPFWQGYIHTDLLWNVSNSFSGYKETRIWDVIPYFQFGVVDFHRAGQKIFKGYNLEYAAGLGLINNFRLGKRVDLNLDLSWPIVRASTFGIGGLTPIDKSNTSGKIKAFFGEFGFIPSVKLGLVFNLGRTNFDRHSSVTPVVVPVPFTTEEYNALKKRVEELEKENQALKDEIEALKNQAPDTVYVGSNNVESPAYAFFEMGSAKLTDREKLHLDFFCDNVVANLDEEKGLLVTGSADSATGSAKRNAQLSEQRAAAVKDYLVKKGVAADRIEVESLGGIDGAVESRRVIVSVK